MIATVVSIFPFTTQEDKPGVGFYTIPGAKDGDFSFVKIPDSTQEYYMDHSRGKIIVPVDGCKIAKSIVEDFRYSHAGISANAYPGMFHMPGEFTKEQIAKQFKSELDRITAAQRAWGYELVKVADDDWNKYRRHKAISDLHRYFANILGLKREWAIEVVAETKAVVPCKFCTEIIPEVAIVCPNCKTILNQAKYKELAGVAA